MRNRLTAVALTTIMSLSVGCVSQGQYDDLQQAYRKSQEQVVEMESRLASLNQQIEMLRSAPQQDTARLEELLAERDELMAQLDQLQGRYTDLASRDIAALPSDVDEALKEFAANNSDLVEYDATRGMVKFRSDLTFDLGSAELTSAAEDTLRQLSDLLTQGPASQYEARVVGHTDSVRIAREETKAKHPTNWHLSVHRAISVRNALESGGVPGQRTSVSGYGMYRPVAPNTQSGAESNRRVEVYLKSMTPVNDQYLGSGGGSRSNNSGSTSRSGGSEYDAPAEDEGNIPLK